MIQFFSKMLNIVLQIPYILKISQWIAYPRPYWVELSEDQAKQVSEQVGVFT